MHLDNWSELETYKELNLASLRQGNTTCLYIYYLLRLYDNKGNGYVDYNKFMKFLDFEKLKREQVYTALKNPQHITFFVCKETKNGKVLQYHSLEKVCKQFDLMPGTAVYIAVPNVRTIKKFNAYLYSTLFRTKGSKNTVSLSRQNITDLTGLSVPTQITYEKIAGIQVTPTMACYIVPENMQHIPIDTIVQSLPCKDMFHTISKNRISWQRANKYYSPNVRVYKGRNHRVNKLIRKLGEGSVSNDQRKRATSPKQYYQDVTTTMFTDQRTSYINAYFNIPMNYGKSAQVYRYNLFAPTKDVTEAVPGLYLNPNKFIEFKTVQPSSRITEEFLVG